MEKKSLHKELQIIRFECKPDNYDKYIIIFIININIFMQFEGGRAGHVGVDGMVMKGLIC